MTDTDAIQVLCHSLPLSTPSAAPCIPTTVFYSPSFYLYHSDEDCPQISAKTRALLQSVHYTLAILRKKYPCSYCRSLTLKEEPLYSKRKQHQSPLQCNPKRHQPVAPSTAIMENSQQQQQFDLILPPPPNSEFLSNRIPTMTRDMQTWSLHLSQSPTSVSVSSNLQPRPRSRPLALPLPRSQLQSQPQPANPKVLDAQKSCPFDWVFVCREDAIYHCLDCDIIQDRLGRVLSSERAQFIGYVPCSYCKSGFRL